MEPSLASRRVVVLGGGVAGVEAALALTDVTDGAAEVVLVAPEPYVELDALAAARGFGVISTQALSLPQLAAARGFRYVADRALEVDVAGRTVVLESGSVEPFESLLVAVGAQRVPVLEQVTTYMGTESHDELRALRAQISTADVSSVAVVVPPGVTWPLPGYELAFLLAREARLAGTDLVVTLVTSEPDPLGIFGPNGSAITRELLGAAGIEIRVSSSVEIVEGGIVLVPQRHRIDVDRVVALPHATSIPIAGIPVDHDGFIPVDGHGRVPDCPGVYAAGDCVSFPIKQGGLAALQADVVAAHIASDMGAEIATPTFRPVIRGKLITGDAEWYLRNPIAGGAGSADVDDQPLWMPSAKIWGRYLPHELENQPGDAGQS